MPEVRCLLARFWGEPQAGGRRDFLDRRALACAAEAVNDPPVRDQTLAGISVPFLSLRKMELEPQNTILSTQVSGSMRKLVSLMRVTPEGAGTRLDYRLEIVPSAFAKVCTTS